MLKIWKASSSVSKIQMVIILSLLVFCVYLNISRHSLKNELIKEIEISRKKVIDSIALSFKKQDEILTAKRNYRKKVYKKSKEIDTKLKQDEKEIYNSSVTDNERKRFLTEIER